MDSVGTLWLPDIAPLLSAALFLFAVVLAFCCNTRSSAAIGPFLYGLCVPKRVECECGLLESGLDFFYLQDEEGPFKLSS